MASRLPDALDPVTTPAATDIFIVEQADGVVRRQARSAVGADYATSGANSDITSLSGLTTPLSPTQGGTGADLSATGGASEYVKQATAGANFTVGAIPAADYPDMVGDSGAGGTKGAVPAPAAGDAAASKYLKADGVWTALSGASSTEPYVTIGNTAGLSAERALTAGTGVGIVDGGAGTTVTVAVTGGLLDIAGLAVTNSNFIVGDGVNWVAETGATARTSLGVAIGSDVQAYNANLAAIAGLTSAADKLPYFTGSGTADVADFTAAGRALVDDASATAQRTTLGLVIGTDVQAYDAGLLDIAGLAVTDSNIIVGNGTNWVAESGATARTSLGLTIGTDVQAYDAGLLDIAGLAVTDSNIIVGNGTNWVAESGATARTSLGVAIGSDVQAYDAGLADIAGLAVTDSNIIVGDGANWVAETGATARTSLGAAALGANTFTGAQSYADQILSRPQIEDYAETVNAIGSTGGGTQDIDLALGNVVTLTVDTSANTFTFSNPSATGKACSFTAIITNGGSQTVNFPASVDWAGGAAPTLTASGVDVLTFVTVDAGTIWYGFTAGLAMA
jgi:hypothetical protein